MGLASTSCGCDAGFEGGYEGMVVPDAVPVPEGSLKAPTPADPFRDDPQAGSPQARHYQLWNMPQPVQYRNAGNGGSRVTVTSRSMPRPITVRRAEPLRAQASSPAPTSAKPIKTAIRTASSDSHELRVPANPLRD